MQITIRRPDDFHVHLRQDAMLEWAAYFTEQQFARALVMPNLTPPILTGRDAREYRYKISNVAPKLQALMTIKLTDSTTREMVNEASEFAIAGKLYPEGVTTNSEDGVREIENMYPVFEAMDKNNMVLCLHGELPGVFVLDRETLFLDHLRRINKTFPGLRIVLEHITTEEAVEEVKSLGPNVAATITVHHLMLTLDDVVGGMLNPHNFCKPVAKSPYDRDALLEAAFSGNKKFFLGTDSAPHLRQNKECRAGCAGVFSAPVAMQCLAQIFEEHGKLGRLEQFTSEFGASFYDLEFNEGTLTLERESWQVPAEYYGVVPFMAGKTLNWSIV